MTYKMSRSDKRVLIMYILLFMIMAMLLVIARTQHGEKNGLCRNFEEEPVTENILYYW